MERQFRRYFEVALRRRGITGETLLQLLETRLDNVVFRLGFANTRRGARQLVGHGHVAVNGTKVDISSFNVKAGDTVTVRDKPKSRQLATRNLDLTQIVPVPDWLTVNRDAMSGTVARIPSREEIAPIVNEQLIVELYSQRRVRIAPWRPWSYRRRMVTLTSCRESDAALTPMFSGHRLPTSPTTVPSCPRKTATTFPGSPGARVAPPPSKMSVA